MDNWTVKKISTVNSQTKDHIDKLKRSGDITPDKGKLISLLESLLVLTKRVAHRNNKNRISVQKYRQRMKTQMLNQNKKNIDNAIWKLIMKPESKHFTLSDWYNALKKEGIVLSKYALYKRLGAVLKRTRDVYSGKKQNQKDNAIEKARVKPHSKNLPSQKKYLSNKVRAYAYPYLENYYSEDSTD